MVTKTQVEKGWAACETFLGNLNIVVSGTTLVTGINPGHEGDDDKDGSKVALAAQPPITVPTITFDGADDGVRKPAPADASAHNFTGPRSHRVVPGVGHNMPQEVPEDFAAAVVELAKA